MKVGIIGLNGIDNKKLYQGYLWISNKPAPQVLLNSIFDGNSLVNGVLNPFIAEGYLWCNESKISYRILTESGTTKVYKYDLNTTPEGWECNEICYLPHRLDKKIEKVCFKEFWAPEEDALCEKMMVLKPVCSVFVGFKNKGGL